MDKAALKRKLREIEKALCLRVEQKYFEPLHKDVTDWKSWSRLCMVAEATSCDPSYILLAEECCKRATRDFLGDTC